MIMLHWQFYIIYYNVKKPHTRRNFPGKKGGTSAPVIPGKIIIESLSISNSEYKYITRKSLNVFSSNSIL